MLPTEPTPPAGPELLLALDGVPGRTLRDRLTEAVREAVRSGRLAPGTRLPSSRSLASDLGVSRGVVVNAYAQLSGEGVLIGRPGSGTVVAAAHPGAHGGAPARSAGAAPPPGPGIDIDLRPGPPDLSAFPRSTWLAAMRGALRELPDRELGYVSPWGTEALRRALAGYLPRVRGAVVGPEAVVVVSGVTQGLTLLVRVLRDHGHRELAVESPSNAVQRVVLGRHGLRIVDVPVDEEGIDVGALARTGARAVLVTPAHQFPRGVLLSAARRGALLRWADDVDGTVVEDDYDSEFRYERQPTGALQGLAPHRVALVGSVSKTLAPGLRLGWVVAPPHLREGVIAGKRDDDFGTAVLEQHALARLLASGDYDRHLRALRRRYRQRRDALLRALERELPGWPTTGAAAGLHLLLQLPLDLDEEALVAEAGALGLAVQETRGMYGALAPRPELVLGYARCPGGVLDEGVRRLAVAARRQAGRPGRVEAPPPWRVPATALDYF